MEAREKISILTPLYEMAPEYVERALHSVKAQESPRYELEWLIAVHNMPEAYLKTITDITQGTAFARVLDVKEPARCLGAVRNILLKTAGGDYIFWLDGDDELTPGFTVKVADQLKKTGADMAVFPCVAEGLCNARQKRAFFEAKLPCDSQEILDHGDIRICDALEGLFINVWSWGYKGSFIRSCGVEFDQTPGASFCDGNYVFEAASRARQILLLPETKGYVYYIREDSDFQSRARDPGRYWTGLKRFMDRLSSFRNTDFPDINNWMWTQISQAMSIMMRVTDVSAALRMEIAHYISSGLRDMQVMRSDRRFDGGEGISLAAAVLAAFPDAADAFGEPEWKHMKIHSGMTDKALIQEKVKNTASEYSGFRLLPDPDNCFRGIVTRGASPEVLSVSISGYSEDRMSKTVDGYIMVEELRGFGADEVRCRITLFDTGKDTTILISWDGHFLSDSAVSWLKTRLFR